jgi:hypothetical protein
MRSRPSLSYPVLASLAGSVLVAACLSEVKFDDCDGDGCPPEGAAGTTSQPGPDAGQPPEPDSDVALDAGTPVDTPPAEAPDAAAPPVEAASSAKVDLLLVVDNSISMSDKQSLLARSLPALVQGLTNPVCVDGEGQRSTPPVGQGCAAGSRRVLAPVADINVAVISSSLGDVGANEACASGETDDRAHPIGALPRGAGLGTNGAGILQLRAGDDVGAFSESLAALVDAVGQSGCGWEMTLESMYRFLIDPLPPERLERVLCNPGDVRADCVRPVVDDEGRIVIDDALLAQRAAFLRPDSELAIVLLSDENDCSVRTEPQNWVVFQISNQTPLFRGSSACDANPNDPCCYACPLAPPDGCAADPVCLDVGEGGSPGRLEEAADGRNLRCFDQKRRFGFDFLYPTARYVNALSAAELCDTRPDLSAADCDDDADTRRNPLFAGGREPASVLLSGIVGVPWQLIAAEESASGAPLSEQELRFTPASELAAADWSALIGSSQASPPVAPTSPFMRESPFARDGVERGNAINGREYDTANLADTPDDLQFACIFPMATPRDCSLEPQSVACDCIPGDNDRPLCEETPGESPAGTTQRWAKAFPGLRQLEVLRGLGEQAALGSICARNTSEPAQPDFAYRPALAGVLERLEARLASPAAVDAGQ